MRAEQMQLILLLFQFCIRIICIWYFMAFDHRLHRSSYQPSLRIIVELYIKRHLLSNKGMSLYCPICWSYLISKTKTCGKCEGYGAPSTVSQLLVSRWSCSSSDGPSRTRMALRDFLTAARQCGSKSWDHWQGRWSSWQLMWNIPAKFPIHLFTAAGQNSTKGFSTELWEVRPEQRKQHGGTRLKCWEFFSSQLGDRSACNESASWRTDSDTFRMAI